MNLEAKITAQLMQKCNALSVTSYGTACYIAIKWISYNI